MSRLSETPQPERDAGRDSAVIWMFDVSRVIYFGWVWLCNDGHVYNRIFCMFDMSYERRMMGWVWYWHVKWMNGLELKGYVINMRWDPRFMGWWWSEVWIQNLTRMRDYLRGWYGNVNMILIFSYCWIMNVGSCQRINSLGSLGETSGVALQWSGRNPMAPVSGCPWWCPICITK